MVVLIDNIIFFVGYYYYYAGRQIEEIINIDWYLILILKDLYLDLKQIS